MRSFIILLLTALSTNAINVDYTKITTSRGDTLPDFSFVGYRQGDHKLPSSIPRNATITIPASKSSSDDQTAKIQAALDTVSKAGGGVVELAAGKHYLSSADSIVIGNKTYLRGASIADTIVYVKGKARSVFSMGNSGVKAKAVTSSNITTSYVPIGATHLTVADGSSFKINQTVYVQRAASAAWIRDNGMAHLVRHGKHQTWIKAGTLIKQPRMIKAIQGNNITLDVPLTDAIDKKYATGSVQAYTAKGTNNAGIESMQIILSPTCSGDPITSTRCATFSAVAFQSFTVDSWAQDLNITGFVTNFVKVMDGAQRITLQNIVSRRDKESDGSAGWGFDIAIDGTQVLVQNCSTVSDLSGARSFAVALGGQTPGPNAVLNQRSSLMSQIIQPHMRWAHGFLVENSYSPISIINRNIAGSGHGWTVNAAVAWNSDAVWAVESPPLGINWAVGMRGTKGKDTNGTEVATGEEVMPKSLYAAQLQARRK